MGQSPSFGPALLREWIAGDPETARIAGGDERVITQKTEHERRDRAGPQRLRRAHLNDMSVMQQDHEIGNFERLLHIVGHKEAGDAGGFVQTPKLSPQLLADSGIERSERFIEHQDTGLDGQRPGQSSPLALATRKFVRPAVRQPVEVDEPKERLDPPLNLFGRGALVARFYVEAKGHIFVDGHVAEQGIVLENKADPPPTDMDGPDVFAIEVDGSFIGYVQASQNPKKSGLSRTGGTKKRHKRSAFQRKGDPIERPVGAKPFRDMADFQFHRAAFGFERRELR